ncbi:MAG TPA: hypothetical protein VK879_18960, partial [Candidatus Sulfomarinibacteraceae bacterium]|nr:hypothetical protein [Candidatus Sulfomarinibacteraceae bacterium]
GLLALFLLLSVGWHVWRTTQARLLAPALAALALLSLLFLVVVPPAWLALFYQLLAWAAVIGISGPTLRARGTTPEGKGTWLGTAALLLPTLALSAGLLYQLLPNLYAILGWPGPPPLTGLLFNAGEMLVIGSVAVWWWAFGRTRNWRLWLWAALPALLFTLSFLRDPAMTGILAIWSTGLTLFLPWPLYALALWLAGVTLLAAWGPRRPLAIAMLLLIAAGYAPQLSTQLFCAIIALWLLARPRSLTQEQPSRSLHPAPLVLRAAE